MQIKCGECQHYYELDLQEKPREDGVVEVGFECPDCHIWNHGYFTNPKLEQQRALLARFADKARRSARDWKRYQQKKEEFRRSFERLNGANWGLMQAG
jgi:hypothetical protein